MKTLGHLLATHRRMNLTRPRYEKLSSFFKGDWPSVYNAKLKDWQASGVDNKGLEKFFGTSSDITPAQELERFNACGAQLLTPEHPAYPPLWHNIPQSPAVVFGRGNLDLLATKSVAVVGSRRMTDYGTRALNKLLGPVFETGITVVSGLAYGVDAAAHQLALKTGTPTVAVLGNGIDHIYPKNNARLAVQILETNGLIISEYLPGVEAIPEYFPQRNRLVAGLAQATVVIEGAVKSGSLITGRLANEFGREVWAVPGDVFRTFSGGPNQLISQGEAAPLLNAEQLLESLRLTRTADPQQLDLTPAEAELVKVLGQQPQWETDIFLSQFSQPAGELNAILTLLELKGVVQQQGSQIYLG